MTYVFESGPSVSQGALPRNRIRYLLRAEGDAARASAALYAAGFSPILINTPNNQNLGQLTCLVDIDRGVDGTVDTGPLLDSVVGSELDVLELTPVASVPIGK